MDFLGRVAEEPITISTNDERHMERDTEEPQAGNTELTVRVTALDLQKYLIRVRNYLV